jgi:hypothetical protein
MKLTYEAILQDPKIVERIMIDARRERARTMHRMLIEPITRLFTTHAARPHLARQG